MCSTPVARGWCNADPKSTAIRCDRDSRNHCSNVQGRLDLHDRPGHQRSRGAAYWYRRRRRHSLRKRRGRSSAATSCAPTKPVGVAMSATAATSRGQARPDTGSRGRWACIPWTMRVRVVLARCNSTSSSLPMKEPLGSGSHWVLRSWVACPAPFSTPSRLR